MQNTWVRPVRRHRPLYPVALLWKGEREVAGRAGLAFPPLAYDVTVPRPSRQGFGEHQCRAYSAAVVASFLFLTKYLRSLWRYLVLKHKKGRSSGVPYFNKTNFEAH